jgi:large subunit ribosomal protein L15
MKGLHTLNRTTKRKAPSVGRGGKRGKTSGRGMKGQKSRAGNRPRPELRDIIKKIPKLRGFGKNRGRTFNPEKVIAIPVSLSKIESSFGAGELVTPKTLSDKGLVKVRGGKLPKIKILANGNLKTKVSVKSCQVSKIAKESIESAGGTVE